MGTLSGYPAAGLIATQVTVATSRRHFASLGPHWKSSWRSVWKQVEILFAMVIGILPFGDAQRARESAWRPRHAHRHDPSCARELERERREGLFSGRGAARLCRAAQRGGWGAISGPPTSIIQRGFGEAEAARERLEDALRQLGRFVQQGREVAALDHEQAQRSLGHDAGGAG